MKNKILLLFLFLASLSYSQISGTYFSKEFSKDISLYKAKEFLINNVLQNSEQVKEFSIIPLAAASSGELTSLIYKSDNNKGLIIGFYGNYWNEQGVVYQGYSFKNFPEKKAIKFLNIIENSINTHKKFLQEDNDNNNITFKFDDITILIYSTNASSYKIRLFWKGFNATWEKKSFRRTKRRFEKKINKHYR